MDERGQMFADWLDKNQDDLRRLYGLGEWIAVDAGYGVVAHGPSEEAARKRAQRSGLDPSALSIARI